MEISDIKQHLSILEVAHQLGLKLDKHNRTLCPFHPDTKPSLQFSKEKNIATCFSTNCSLGTVDQIGLVKAFYKLNDHQAILKAKSLINGNITPTKNNTMQTITKPLNDLSRAAVLTKMFTYFKNAVASSQPARDYLKKRSLDYLKLEIGYNSGQFHHGQRKDEHLIKSCVEVGLLYPFGTNSRVGGQAYKAFGKSGIVFSLRNKENKITGFYFRSILNDDDQRHFYLKNREGLYPKYPNPETIKLIITESIIDAATLLQHEEITKEYEILAMYGTENLTEEHKQAIKALKKLQEIIFFLNGDAAGKKAVHGYEKENGEKKKGYAEILYEILPNVKITNIEPPPDEDVNSLLQGHEPDIFIHLLQKRQILFSFQPKKLVVSELVMREAEPTNENSTEKKKEQPAPPVIATKTNGQEQITQKQPGKPTHTANKLNTQNPHWLVFRTQTANYYIKGGLRKELDNMRVSMDIEHPETHQKSRTKLDLYEDKQVEKVSREAAEKLNLRTDLIEQDLNILTGLLDEYRGKLHGEKETEKPKEQPLTQTEKQEYIRFGRQKKLMQNINTLIGKTGVIGEEKSRLFLFAAAVSHLMYQPLNIVIQGGSGSGKSFLIKKISYLVPQQKVKRYTRLSEKSFYNFREYDLCNALLILEDYDGMNEEVEYAFRELQSNGILISGVSDKEGEYTQIQTRDKIVRGPIASMVATTRSEIYHDNSTRVFFIAVDESEEQTQKIIDYKNQKANREIREEEEEKAKNYLQSFVKTLKPYKVKNPYLKYIKLPVPHDQLRRLHELFESFCQQITLIYQHQRSKTKTGELITEKEDVKAAIDLMFDSIILKVDELDGSLRDFYERLKKYVLEKGKEYLFIQREIRHQLKISKTQLFRNINQLEELEYIQKRGTGSHGATNYKIIYWDDNEALRQKIKDQLSEQLKQF